MQGHVKRLLVEKGFGFIGVAGGKEFFFHRSAVAEGGFDFLREGDAVEFDEERSPKGPRAANVRPGGR